MAKIKKTKHYSYTIKDLPKGCQRCVTGEKLVLFLTGLCAKRCYFCPIAETRMNKDVVFANEWKIEKWQDVVEEARLCGAKGAGITGGDPLVKLDRVIKYITIFKNKFSKDFHIHLYTPLKLVTPAKLERLYEAGLDEIRFHPDLDYPEEWKKIEMALPFRWDVGVEIPVLPDREKETVQLIDYIKDKVKFLNLNELEMSPSNADEMMKKGLETRSLESSAVKGSQELAMKLLKRLQRTKLQVHFCTVKLKDAVQLTNRIKRRAASVKQDFDEVTQDGLLYRGVVYLKELVPSFSYGLMLTTANHKPIVKKLYKLKKEIQRKFNIPNAYIAVDAKKLRLMTSVSAIRHISPYLKREGYVPAKVLEYPTWDGLEVDVEFL